MIIKQDVITRCITELTYRVLKFEGYSDEDILLNLYSLTEEIVIDAIKNNTQELIESVLYDPEGLIHNGKDYRFVLFTLFDYYDIPVTFEQYELICNELKIKDEVAVVRVTKDKCLKEA